MAEPRWTWGMFVWRELTTDDVEGARRFYGALLGWTFSEQQADTHPYWIASRGAQRVCGLMPKPPGVPMPSMWTSYLLTEDVDAAAGRFAAEGGRILFPPTDIPGVGRFAVVMDPFGAALEVFRPLGPESPVPPFATGTFCWETLVTPDPPRAATFYERTLGLGLGKAPNGVGTVLTAGAGGPPVADVQQAPKGVPGRWTTYVAVESAERSRDEAARLGGRVLAPRIDVPQVGTVALVADPSGAALGLFEPLPR